MNLNKVQLIGNITKDIELRKLPSGQSVASIGLATNRNWKEKDGNKKEQVEFHNLIAFGQTADNLNQYVVKGQNMYFEGRLQTRSWEDQQSGKKQYKTEIVVEQFQFGNKPQGGSQANKSTSNDGVDEISEDMIPF
jgi:single-strand DNA-binding protein